MSDGFSIEKTAAYLIKSSASDLATPVANAVKKYIGNLKITAEIGFHAYFYNVLARYSHTKTLLSKHDPMPLDSIYVPLHLADEDQEYKNIDIKSLNTIGKYIAIIGGAGSGKSTLLRHLLIDRIKLNLYSDAPSIPVFIELRRVTSQIVAAGESGLDASTQLGAIILSSLNEGGLSITADQLQECQRLGLFTFFFDGFDELPLASRTTFEKQLLNMAHYRNRNTYIVSSRTRSRFESWERFKILEVSPLEFCQMQDITHRFPIRYSQHFSDFIKLCNREQAANGPLLPFLSNPLLLTTAFRTFIRFKQLDSDPSLFFDQVFDALWEEHDSAKEERVERVRYSFADKGKFRRAFFAFCLMGCVKEVYSFSPDQLQRAIAAGFAKAGLHEDQHASIDGFQNDLTESLSLLVRDEGAFSLVHRSFQEWGASQFLRDADQPLREACWPLLFARGEDDNVLRYHYGTSPRRMELELFTPALEDLIKTVLPTPDPEKIVPLSKYFVGSVNIYSSDRVNDLSTRCEIGITYKESFHIHVLRFIVRLRAENNKRLFWPISILALRESLPAAMVEFVSNMDEADVQHTIILDEYFGEYKALFRSFVMPDVVDYLWPIWKAEHTRLLQSQRSTNSLVDW